MKGAIPMTDNEIIKALECCFETDLFADIGKIYSEIKAEAVKEFAERLKENKIDIDVSFGYGKEHYTEAVAVVEIDRLVKEFTEGKNDE
jgi:hypothetical protein